MISGLLFWWCWKRCVRWLAFVGHARGETRFWYCAVEVAWVFAWRLLHYIDGLEREGSEGWQYDAAAAGQEKLRALQPQAATGSLPRAAGGQAAPDARFFMLQMPGPPLTASRAICLCCLFMQLAVCTAPSPEQRSFLQYTSSSCAPVFEPAVMSDNP